MVETHQDEYDGSYDAYLDDEHKVSGHELYYTNNGAVTLPLGTYTVQETLAPEGYLLEGADENSKNWVTEQEYEAPIHVGKVTLDDNTVQAFRIGNELDNEHQTDETVKRFDITLEKHDGDTQASLGNIEFTLTSLTTGESHSFWTDSHGNYTSSSETNPHHYHTNEAEDEHSGLWFYGSADESEGAPVDDSVGALPYDSYRLDEVEGPNNEGYEMIHETFTVTENDYAGEVIDLGLLNNYPPDEEEGPEPYLHSQAWAGDTGTQLCYAGDQWVTLYDDVWYYNLEPGATYYLYGIAYDVDTGEPEIDHYGNVISAVTEFVADESGDGMIVQEFYFDVEDLSGHRAVFYESIYAIDEDGNAVFIAAEDPEDYPNQTIYFPQVGTTLVDADSNSHYSVADGTVTLIDTVTVTEVPKGETVIVSGTLMDRDTGEAILDADGNPVTASVECVSEGLDSWTVEIEFTFDAAAISSGGVVAFEDLYLVIDEDEDTPEDEDEDETTEDSSRKRGVLVGRHADLTDEGQTVEFPEIHTTATDSKTGTHTSDAATDTVIIDRVDYTGLIVGEEYTITGTLMDQSTGEPLVDSSGNTVTSEVTFVAGTESGYIDMEFSVDTSLLAGTTIVVFEDLYQDGVKVATHSDITDVAQSVNVPGIHTTATDSETGTHTSNASIDTVIIDRVDYESLTVGEEYTISGTLMDQSTGEPLVDSSGNTVTSEVTFVAETESGYIDMEFNVDTSLLAGTTIVVFEDLMQNGVPVASHSDITDVAQSVNVPEIGTTATDADDGDKEVEAGSVTVNDEVEYSGLEPGRTYTMSGTLMDKSTGKAVTVNGEAVSAEVEFTPTASSGSVIVPISVDTSSMAGSDLVVFEKCYELNDEGIYVEVASHEDLDDEGQTVTVKTPEKVATPTDTPTTTKTGLRNTGIIAAIAGAIALAIVLVLYRRRRAA